VVSIKEGSVFGAVLFTGNDWRLSTAVIIDVWPNVGIKDGNWQNALFLVGTEFEALIAFFALP
jgi:hypothetical protein